MQSVTYSVVIGFKDWGLERLALTLTHLVRQVADSGGEVVVSDYGSVDGEAVRTVCEESGARYVYTRTDGVWSRSRALNAGFAISRGEYLIATDADMLFSPTSMPRILEHLQSAPNTFLLLQCRDLPQRFDTEGLTGKETNWQELDSVSRFRPRYGMGGMIAFSRDAYLLLRGFDERMAVYGGEDIDFANRLRRAGYAMVWEEDPQVRMYHVWHPSSRKASEATDEGAHRVNANAQIILNDETYIRNVSRWRHQPLDAKPVASIVICTRNRSEYLGDAVYSALSQTVKDIEVIVVDDGSDDETGQVLAEIEDPRLKVLRQEPSGIAAARNLAATHTRSDFTVVFDDDDIMLPDRVASHFAALQAGDDGTYGGWIDFQDGNLDRIRLHPGREFSDDVVRVLGHVYLHPTLMVPTDLIREIGYDTTYRSGSDFNLAIKMLRSGLRLRNMRKVAILRRLHDRQVTHADADFQKASWATTKALTLLSVSKPQYDFIQKREDKGTVDLGLTLEDVKRKVRTFGPSGTSSRTVVGRLPADAEGLTRELQASAVWSVEGRGGLSVIGPVRLENPSWKEIWNVARSATGLEIAASLDASDIGGGQDALQQEALDSAVHALVPSVDPASNFIVAWLGDQKASSNFTVKIRGAELHGCINALKARNVAEASQSVPAKATTVRIQELR